MDARESIPDPLCLLLNGPEALRAAMDPVQRFSELNRLLPDDAARLAVIVEELVTNLYEHGSLRGGEECAVQLACREDEIELILTDRGKPFDPRGHDADRAIPDRGGGAGLNLVRAWAIQIDYESSDGANRLTVRLPISIK